MTYQQVLNVVDNFLSAHLEAVGIGAAALLALLMLSFLLTFRSQSGSEPSGAFYIVALIFPPLALLLIGRPLSAVVCLLLWIPGSVLLFSCVGGGPLVLILLLIGRQVAAIGGIGVALLFFCVGSPLVLIALIWALLAVSEHNTKAARARDARLARMIAAATSAAVEQQRYEWPGITE